MTYRSNMEFQQHGKKIKVDDDDVNRDNQEQVLCYDFWKEDDFWNEAPDDVLTEIFIRHPDSRSALRTTTVCRRWRSLISRNPHFIERFKSHHRRHHHHRYPPESLPWAIMLRKSRFFQPSIPGPEHFQPLWHLHSDEWVFLHEKLPDNYFDFLPSSPCMVIVKASCNDLFLVSISPDDQDHYVCNPITKQFVHLPSIPIINDGVIGYGLIVNVRFKVVEVLPPSLDMNLEPNSILPVNVFCSESRKWETRSFPCPGLSISRYDNYSMDIVTWNGVLYWVHKSGKRKIVVYLDLSNEKCGTINTPSTGGIVCSNRIGMVTVSGGLNELRLIQVDADDQPENAPLKVWRLNYNNNYDDDSNWFLLHNRTLVRPKNLSDAFPLAGVFLHPTNGDLVLVVWGKIVIEYDLVNATYKKIGELRTAVSWSIITPFIMVAASNFSNLDIF